MRTAELTLPGLPPRRLLGDPSAGGLGSPFFSDAAARASTASSGSTRRRRSRTRSTTARRRVLERSLEETAQRARGRRAAPIAGSCGRSSRTPTTCSPTSSARCAVPRIPCRSPASASRRSGRPSAWRAVGFAGARARALFAGLAAHSMLPLTSPPSAALRARARPARPHVGWPLPRGGSQAIADALRRLPALARRRDRDRPARRLARRAAAAPAPCCSTSRRGSFSASPAAGLPAGYRRRLERFRYGPGVFKLDLAARRPDPVAGPGVRARRHRPPRRDARGDRRVRGCGGRRRVHRSGRTCWSRSRASSTRRARRPGKHTVWAYCHVPNGSPVDMTDADRGADRALCARLSRSRARAARSRARGARALQRRTTSAATSTAALQDLRQLFTGPVARPVPYATPLPGVFLCSSSTPPGGGVHGMCGYWAARAALRRLGR